MKIIKQVNSYMTNFYIFRMLCFSHILFVLTVVLYSIYKVINESYVPNDVIILLIGVVCNIIIGKKFLLDMNKINEIQSKVKIIQMELKGIYFELKIRG